MGKLFARVVLKSSCRYLLRESTLSQSAASGDIVFSLCRLQEKCREQRQSLYLALIDLTMAFGMVSREGLFKVLVKIGCPPTLLSIIKSFYDDIRGMVVFDSSTSTSFNIKSGVNSWPLHFLAPSLLSC